MGQACSPAGSPGGHSAGPQAPGTRQKQRSMPSPASSLTGMGSSPCTWGPPWLGWMWYWGVYPTEQGCLCPQRPVCGSITPSGYPEAWFRPVTGPSSMFQMLSLLLRLSPQQQLARVPFPGSRPRPDLRLRAGPPGCTPGLPTSLRRAQSRGQRLPWVRSVWEPGPLSIFIPYLPAVPSAGGG